MDVDVARASRLRNEQTKAISDTADQLAQLQKYLDDYEALATRLKTLPDKITHDIMVPFGKCAFMPGQLVHANEILVLLGDNWFSERSAKQAADIANRRAQGLRTQMSELLKQKSLLEPRLDFTTELQDMMEERSNVHEIREDYDPETEKIWKEQHHKNMRSHKRMARADRETATKLAQSQDTHRKRSDTALWERLDDLEIQERRNREMSRMDEDVDQIVMHNLHTQSDKSTQQATEDRTQPHRHVQWKDQTTEYSSSEGSQSDCDDDEDDDDETCVSRPTTITFSHSHMNPQSSQPSSPPDDKVATQILSPSDIYSQFCPTTPISILKHIGSEHLQTHQQPQTQKHEHCVESMSTSSIEPEAFSGQVREQSTPETITRNTVPNKTCPVGASATMEAPKRISRFKARQMKKES